MFKITHICNNFIASKVHMELIRSIQKKDRFIQSIYVPVRSSKHLGSNYIDDVDLKYFNYRFNFLKFFPLIKVIIVYIGFILLKNKSSPNLIIAHNFWSDGVVAFLNYIFFKTPYILVIRNTDMNIFVPKLRHYHWLMKIMIKKSKGLVFLNNSYRESFKNNYFNLYDCAKKVKVLHNGVNDFWINNQLNDESQRTNSLIYVGAFNKNKNLSGIVSAIKLLNENEEMSITLSLVGGNDEDLKKLLNIDNIPNFIKTYGVISDKNELLKLYRQSKIFIMPSFFETFGLVYIESLLQGCNVIHSKGQGIDGVFSCEFIQSVNPSDINDISDKIKYLLNLSFDPHERKSFLNKISNDFRWDSIAEQYINF